MCFVLFFELFTDGFCLRNVLVRSKKGLKRLPGIFIFNPGFSTFCLPAEFNKRVGF